MKIHYRDPITDRLSERWEAFEEQATVLASQLRQFGFRIDQLNYSQIRAARSWRFTAILKNSQRVIHLSLTTSRQHTGAVSFLIYPKSGKGRHINLYKYLRKHFGMLDRKYLFLSRYRGDFSYRLQKVIKSYARFSQFYMQSILQGTSWDE
ncbi:MAG: hypothetical protein HKN87_13750 [Saprospiraceae bacterium]|nr:hypothetical protein [Saprospiraceae bacterium]